MSIRFNNSSHQKFDLSLSFSSSEKTSSSSYTQIKFSGSDRIKNLLVCSSIENEQLLIETQKLAERIEKLEKNRKKGLKKFSVDYRIREEDFLIGEETLELLRDQVNCAKGLEYAKLNKTLSLPAVIFPSSFKGLKGSCKDLWTREDFKFKAFLKLVILFNFN